MDHLVQHIAEGDNNTESYALPGIWEFAVANNDNVTSFGELAGSIEMSNGNVMNREHDPMIMGHCTFKKLRQNAHNGNANATIINNESDDKRTNTTRVNEHGETKQGERNCGDAREKTAKPPEPPKQDYIHVRARRGQATDSHSLAERARREKISERMKILQDLVPGCNKVIGKALVLDEIINYIQSLQRQVEFLSLKLESVNSRVPPGIESFPSKEFTQQAAFDASSLGFSSQEARGYSGRPPEWLHMQLGGGFERTS